MWITFMKYIQLTQGKKAIIDDIDYLLVSQFKWHFRKSGRTNGKNGYAEHSQYDPKLYRKARQEGHTRYNKKAIFMHNLILKPKQDFQVDHINRNGLDNRRSNLRIGTVSQNYANFPKKQNTKSKYRGVSFLKRIEGKPWQASTTVNGKLAYIGVYKTEKEAALAYNKAAKKFFGEFAQLNKL